MNPTPETLGKAKGKISSSCQSGSETESFSMQYVRTVHKFVPAYCHSYSFMAKCSFKGLTYAGCVDTRTQPGGESFLPSLLHFYWTLLNSLCQDFFLQRLVAAGCCQPPNFHSRLTSCSTITPFSPCLCKGSCSSSLFFFRGVFLTHALLRSNSPWWWWRWGICKAANGGDTV